MKLLSRFLVTQAVLIVYVVFHTVALLSDPQTYIANGTALSTGLWIGYVLARRRE